MKLFTFLILICLSGFTYAEQNEANPWRKPANENLVYMQTDKGLIIIELAPFMAPNHTQRFVNLVNEGHYDGLDFYRVIEGFVAQGGDNEDSRKTKYSAPLKAEFTRKASPSSSFILVQDNAFFAPQTGYLNGFSAGKDPKTQEEWLLHCPGNIAMARTNDINSATSHFYFVMGQAPRHLDRNMSSFGRVIHGMNVVHSVNRAGQDEAGGIIADKPRRTKIQWVKMADKMDKAKLLPVEVHIDDSQAAQSRIESARKRESEFFHFKGNGNLDMCYYQLRTRIAPESEG